MADELLQFNITIEAGADAPDDLIDELRRQVFAELSEMDVEAISLALGEPAPEGAKSAEALSSGTLVVTVQPAFLPRLVEYLQAWARRAEQRKVHITSQAGDRSVEIEYSPPASSAGELISRAAALTEALAPESKAS